MCLIIAPGKNGEKALLPRDIFDFVFNRNNDGFGAMWCEDGRVKHFKTLGLTADEVYAKMEEYAEKHSDIVFHMRYKTHGKIIPGLSHPFRVLNKNRHGRDLFFMHNGVLSNFGNSLKHGQSDTTVFKDKILIPLLTRNPDALDDPEVFNTIEKLTSGSRLIFMDSEGKTWRTSPSSWNNSFDLTLSNTYMLPSEYELKRMRGEVEEKKVINIGTPPANDTIARRPARNPAIYNEYRDVVFSKGSKYGYWCTFVDNKKFVRTESGLLFHNRGDYVTLEFEKDYIKSKDEWRFLSVDAMVSSPNYGKSFGDDDEPFSDEAYKELNDDVSDIGAAFGDALDVTGAGSYPDTSGTVGDAVVGIDAKLRYARMVHNTHGNEVACREQLVGDLVAMDNYELFGLIKEDPETTLVVVEELVEIVLEMNNVLFSDEDPTLEDLVFDPDALVDCASMTNHHKMMKKISDLRKEVYKTRVEEQAKKEEDKKLSETERRLEEAFAATFPEEAEFQPVDKKGWNRPVKEKKNKKAA